MRKVLGLLALFIGLIVLACTWEQIRHGHIKFLTAQNARNLLTLIGLFGILSLGQAFVIITGGIDLSVGSVVALIGILAADLLDKGNGVSPWIVIPAMLTLAAALGLWHGVLIARARMQPFVVTLCGLFFYRGIARVISGDETRGFGGAFPKLGWLANGFLPTNESFLPVPFLIFLLLGAIVAAFLHLTPTGRHFFALGANEEAARFSGLRTHRLKILAYTLCSLLTGIGALLLAFNINSLGPANFGSFYELYAIAGVVLGGCSLRGGSGNVLGVVIGAALIRVLTNLVSILEIPSQLEYVVIGGAILLGVLIDELFAGRQDRAPQ
ncbi:MAG TPA: ABC transporter permease [Candidatus Hydrogenedentes bacterium]|nr:ABC transporter permease [Candidatus Hydrogenedentota bacterium]HPG66086.1 ABC transporter permease [Candidatus Hydrogenedentota bacterium]